MLTQNTHNHSCLLENSTVIALLKCLCYSFWVPVFQKLRFCIILCIISNLRILLKSDHCSPENKWQMIASERQGPGLAL